MSVVWQRASGLWKQAPVDLLVVVSTAVLTLPYLLVPYVVEESGGTRQAQLSQIAPQWSAALTVAASLALLFRHRAVPLVLGWTVVCGALHVVVAGEVGPAALPIMLALFELAIRAERRTWLVAGACVAGLMTLVAALANADGWYRSLGTSIWVALPLAVAQAVRNRRAYVAAAEERARQAEQERQDSARRQVMEERMRIARELHDVLAHSIAVINIQSGVAAHVIDQHPDQAKQALVHINDTSDTALSELRSTLDVLRQDADQVAPTAPLPNLDQVDELLANARASGLDVRATLTGVPAGVAPKIGLVAYRVLQEALTNVLKHANAQTVDVRLEVSEDRVRLEVRDDGSGSPQPPSYGHGRIGMRERVHAVGGTLVDGPADSGYRVSVTLPLSSNALEIS